MFFKSVVGPGRHQTWTAVLALAAAAAGALAGWSVAWTIVVLITP
jgi:hypothetical protein